MQKPRKKQQTTLQNVEKGANMKVIDLYDNSRCSMYIWNEKGVTEKDLIDSSKLIEIQDKEIEDIDTCMLDVDLEGKAKEVIYGGVISAIKVKIA